MTSCIKCGGSIGDFDAGGDMICQNCEAAGAGGAGAAANVPCQRCGMYLPSHELRMFNSRLYCSYCIMDMQDEEKRGKAAEGKGTGKEERNASGTCERCGRSTDTLYSIQGRRLCSSCFSLESGSSGGSPSMIGMILERVALALGVRQKPKPITVLPLEKLRAREAGGPEEELARKKAMEKFDLKERRMMEEEEGEIGTVEPLSEERTGEKKPSPEARRKFFPKLGGEKKD
ncbi:MAG: hypothetical protein NTX79_05365 [Candidatus Micrarchaeota archaeon]|nr:hypothetical protein [Candidatus Micrarchaeota archaeon]